MPWSQEHKRLSEDGDRMFADRTALVSFWQDVALNFYPETADFYNSRALGADFANHLTSSYPVIVRRSLGDALSALLRPVSLDTTSPGVWFNIRTNRDTEKDAQSLRWLDWATKVQRRAMYDHPAGFVRATKEGDHAFSTFGQCVISSQLNRNRDTLLYKSHHLRDVAWTENADGKIDHVQLNWNPTAAQLFSQ